jgi:hypothetical protein
MKKNHWVICPPITLKILEQVLKYLIHNTFISTPSNLVLVAFSRNQVVFSDIYCIIVHKTLQTLQDPSETVDCGVLTQFMGSNPCQNKL